MPDTLIRDFVIPSKGQKSVIIHSNGSVYEPTNNELILYKIADATELPPHGDLIDKDAFIQWLASQDELWERSYTVPQLKEMLRKGMPVIVPRSE